MIKKNENLSPSKKIESKTIFAALKILKKNNNLRAREVLRKVEQTIELDEWDKGTYGKKGAIRWETRLHYMTTGCVKCDYLIKCKRNWEITEQGKKALELGEAGLYKSIQEGYRKWVRERKIS